MNKLCDRTYEFIVRQIMKMHPYVLTAFFIVCLAFASVCLWMMFVVTSAIWG